MLPSTLYIISPMHLQCLKLLRPTVKEEMYIQENTLYDLDLGVKVTCNFAQCSPNHVIYAPAKFKVAELNRLGEEAFIRKTLFDLAVKVTQSIFSQENTLFDIDPQGQGHMKCCPVPSTSCDLRTCKV